MEALVDFLQVHDLVRCHVDLNSWLFLFHVVVLWAKKTEEIRHGTVKALILMYAWEPYQWTRRIDTSTPLIGGIYTWWPSRYYSVFFGGIVRGLTFSEARWKACRSLLDVEPAWDSALSTYPYILRTRTE